MFKSFLVIREYLILILISVVTSVGAQVNSFDRVITGELYCGIGEKDHLLCLEKKHFGIVNNRSSTNANRQVESYRKNGIPYKSLSAFKKTSPYLLALKNNYFCRFGEIKGSRQNVELECGTLAEISNDILLTKFATLETKEPNPLDIKTSLNADTPKEVLKKALEAVDKDLLNGEEITKFFVDMNLNQCKDDLQDIYNWSYDPLKETIEEKFDISSFPCPSLNGHYWAYETRRQGFHRSGNRSQNIRKGQARKFHLPKKNEKIHDVLPTNEYISFVYLNTIRVVLMDMKTKIEKYLSVENQNFDNLFLSNSAIIKLPVSTAQVRKTFFLEKSLCVLAEDRSVYCIDEESGKFNFVYRFQGKKEKSNIEISTMGICESEITRSKISFASNVIGLKDLTSGSESSFIGDSGLNGSSLEWNEIDGEVSFTKKPIGQLTCLSGPDKKDTLVKKLSINDLSIWKDFLVSERSKVAIENIQQFKRDLVSTIERTGDSYDLTAPFKVIAMNHHSNVELKNIRLSNLSGVNRYREKKCFDIEAQYMSAMTITYKYKERKVLSETPISSFMKKFFICADDFNNKNFTFVDNLKDIHRIYTTLNPDFSKSEIDRGVVLVIPRTHRKQLFKVRGIQEHIFLADRNTRIPMIRESDSSRTSKNSSYERKSISTYSFGNVFDYDNLLFARNLNQKTFFEIVFDGTKHKIYHFFERDKARTYNPYSINNVKNYIFDTVSGRATEAGARFALFSQQRNYCYVGLSLIHI